MSPALRAGSLSVILLTAGLETFPGLRPSGSLELAKRLEDGALVIGSPTLGDQSLQGQASELKRDAHQIFREARRSQRRFEELRRRSLPWGDSYRHQCDEWIGRFCTWHDDSDEEIPAEPREVVEARRELIAELEEAAAALPEHGWIAGQLVGYLIEDRRLAAAQRTAERCRPAEHWWCVALTGYVLHHAGDYVAAEAAFQRALAVMGSTQGCRWRDISQLVSGWVRREYRRKSCQGREELERRIWWLADPLYLYPGNDRLTEHFARQVQIHMRSDAATPFGITWGRDIGEIVLRYGWPTHFEKQQPTGLRTARLSTVSHHHPNGRTFLPPPEAAGDASRLDAEDWALVPPGPRSEYAPAYAEFDSTLQHQLALFRRGDSAVVLAASDIDRAGGWGSDPLQAALIVARDERTPWRSVLKWTSERRVVLDLPVPAEPALVSLELFSPASHKAGRVRRGIRPSTAPRVVLDVSDLLILDAPDKLPGSLSEAVPWARGSLRVRTGEHIALYWELYGLQTAGEILTMSLTMKKKGRSFFSKITDALRITGAERPLSLTWEERAERQYPATPRSLAIELPQMSRGSYVLRLEINAHGREPVIALRDLVVEDP